MPSAECGGVEVVGPARSAPPPARAPGAPCPGRAPLTHGGRAAVEVEVVLPRDPAGALRGEPDRLVEQRGELRVVRAPAEEVAVGLAERPEPLDLDPLARVVLPDELAAREADALPVAEQRPGRPPLPVALEREHQAGQARRREHAGGGDLVEVGEDRPELDPARAAQRGRATAAPRAGSPGRGRASAWSIAPPASSPSRADAKVTGGRRGAGPRARRRRGSAGRRRRPEPRAAGRRPGRRPRGGARRARGRAAARRARTTTRPRSGRSTTRPDGVAIVDRALAAPGAAAVRPPIVRAASALAVRRTPAMVSARPAARLHIALHAGRVQPDARPRDGCGRRGALRTPAQDPAPPLSAGVRYGPRPGVPAGRALRGANKDPVTAGRIAANLM